MFSGIIRCLGKLKSITKGKQILIEVFCPELAAGARAGDSIAVCGVCLTVVRKNKKSLWFEIIPQTWKVTRLAALKAGDKLNMEKSLAIGDFLDGNLLTGHVDGVARVLRVTRRKNLRELEFDAPDDLKKFIALRGGIAVDGVSLTVSHLGEHSFAVSLTEYTLDHTNLGGLKAGDRVNLEVDMIGRYLDNLLKYQTPRPARSPKSAKK